jgi:hypothetical protein
VIQCGVYQDASVVPRRTFNANRLVDGNGIIELLVSDDDRVLGEQGHPLHVTTPDHILDHRSRHFCNNAALLDVEEANLVLCLDKHKASSSVEDGLGAREGRRDLFGHVPPEVTHDNRVAGFVQGGKPVPGDENGAVSISTLDIANIADRRAILGERVQLPSTVLGIRLDQGRVLGRVVGNEARSLVIESRWISTKGCQRGIASRGKVVRADVAVLKLVQRAS